MDFGQHGPIKPKDEPAMQAETEVACKHNSAFPLGAFFSTSTATAIPTTLPTCSTDAPQPPVLMHTQSDLLGPVRSSWPLLQNCTASDFT